MPFLSNIRVIRTMQPTTKQFANDIKETQCFYGLQDSTAQEWVIVDSTKYEEQDALLLWSSHDAAKAHLTEEWKDYVVSEISVADWLEFWVDDLSQDNVVIGVNWLDESEHDEASLTEFTQALIEVEKYQ